ncbi:MAG: hypothetical protein IJV04_00185, partial [Lachnospiraceae bacterium]|nr:hypothetical protein [Lachnospiraceae bacterium]
MITAAAEQAYITIEETRAEPTMAEAEEPEPEPEPEEPEPEAVYEEPEEETTVLSTVTFKPYE